MNRSELAAWLKSLPADQARVCIGLDGFVDRVLRVVDKRLSPTEATYIHTLSEYGGRIANAAGLSLNVELVPVLQKLGGNGPIMAGAMACLGSTVSCIGAFGLPEPTPSYLPLLRRACLYTIAQHACTDAYEFDDGKLIASVLDPLNTLSWEKLSGTLGVEKLISLLDEAELVALNNWTMIPHMTDIWKHFQKEIFPYLNPRRRILFFDLADPSKRTERDLREAVETLRGFTRFGTVLLSCNRREAAILEELLKINLHGNDPLETARKLRERMEIDIVSVHTLDAAYAVSTENAAYAPGFFVESPVISVGGGDHFNAGLAFGLLNSLSLKDALLLAGAVSGYYVRTGTSPERIDLASFLCSGEV